MTDKATQNLGNGITGTVEGNTLTLTIPLNRPGQPSASGKTMVLASTRGNVTMNDGITVGLNVYTKK